MEDKNLKISYEFKVTEDMLNYYEFLHGGAAVKIMDATAGYISRDFVNGRTVTKAMNNIVFEKSVYLGETVVATGEIIKIGNSSLRIRIESRIKERNLELSSSGEFTMVSVDENFKPKKIEKKNYKH